MLERCICLLPVPSRRPTPTLSVPENLLQCDDVPEDLWSQKGICRREEKAGLLWEWSAYVTGMLVADWRSLFYILHLV